jgi:TolB-like protein/class 3 adenylate cyclase/tetratricopeptide (TPR) repeat protein
MATTRRLAAILAADVAGYSRLMEADEEGTHERLKAYLHDLIDPKISEHRGHVVKNTGDGLLAEFASIIDAVRCAAEIQLEMAERNASTREDQRIRFRIGINLGDIIAEPEDIFGDGVNVAARLEGLAEPGGICISAAVHDHIVGRLPYRFEDLGARKVKNITRQIHAYRVWLDLAPEAASGQAEASAPKPPLPLPDKPSIAVLPFQNMSGDPGQEYFADGMVEEIITALSRIRWLFVIARNSSFTYKGQAVDIKQVGRELGVRYVLEGSVRKAGGRVRITAQLIDATIGAHLWADRFDGVLEDVFDIQDQVASTVAGVIEPTLRTAEIRRSVERPTSVLTAYDLYLRALAQAYAWEKQGNLAALDFLEQAIWHDPNYGSALALAAACHLSLHVSGWTDNPEESRWAGIEFSRRALRVAADDPDVLGCAAYTLAYFGEDIDSAIEMIDRALALNPSYARGWVISGWLRLWAGQPEEAIGHFEASLRLSPHARRAGTFMAIGVGHFFAQRFDDAVTMLLRSLQEHPGWAPTFRFLAACYAHMGRSDDAREAVRQLRATTPLLVPNADHWRKPEYRKLFLDGLQLAVDEAID